MKAHLQKNKNSGKLIVFEGTDGAGKTTLKKCDSLDESIKIIQRACGLTVVLSTLNQGELCFLPFNRLFHSRYGMYFKFIYKEN